MELRKLHRNFCFLIKLTSKFCGSRLWLEVSTAEAELLRDIFRDTRETDPIQPHRCWHRRGWRTWASDLGAYFRATASGTSAASHRYTPSNSTQSSSTTASASSPGTTNTTQSSTTGQNNSQQGNLISSQLSTTVTPASANPASEMWVLFGVQGPRQPLTMEHIVIDAATNDDIFYRELRKNYRLHRGKLLFWFSFWRFQYCEVVKFKRLASEWVIRDRKDLPTDKEYVYTPRPPTATNPPISLHEFQVRLNACEASCPWRWFVLHECIPQLDTCTSIICFPKTRHKALTTSSPVQPTDVAWGLEAKHRISAAYVFIYHVLIVAGPFAVFGWWMSVHTGDQQNAGVPIIIVLSLLSLFWSTNGILTQGKEGKRL